MAVKVTSIQQLVLLAVGVIGFITQFLAPPDQRDWKILITSFVLVGLMTPAQLLAFFRGGGQQDANQSRSDGRSTDKRDGDDGRLFRVSISG